METEESLMEYWGGNTKTNNRCKVCGAVFNENIKFCENCGEVM